MHNKHTEEFLLDEEVKIVTTNKYLAAMQLIEGYTQAYADEEKKSKNLRKKEWID